MISDATQPYLTLNLTGEPTLDNGHELLTTKGPEPELHSWYLSERNVHESRRCVILVVSSNIVVLHSLGFLSIRILANKF